MSMDYFFMSQEDEKESANPIMVMVDERTDEKCARAVGHKGMGKDQDMEWHMSNELKVCIPGGTAGNIILKSDGEPAFLAVRDAPAKYHGSIVVQEGPAVGESQSNGHFEEAGKTVRDFVRVLKEQIGKTNVKLKCDDVIIQWMIRWRKSGTSRSVSRRSARIRSSQMKVYG